MAHPPPLFGMIGSVGRLRHRWVATSDMGVEVIFKDIAPMAVDCLEG